MNFLAGIPIWGYFIVLAVTFMAVHILVLRPGHTPPRRTSMIGSIASSVVLLLALVFIEPKVPATVLLALVGAALAGVISGRTAAPPRGVKAKEPPRE